MGTILEPLLLCENYYPKSWVCTDNYLGSWAVAYQSSRKEGFLLHESNKHQRIIVQIHNSHGSHVGTHTYIYIFRGRQFIPCFYNLTTSVFVDTRHSVMSSRGSVRIHGELVTIAVTDKCCPRQIGLSVNIYFWQTEHISTCNACRSEVFNMESHILRSKPLSVRVEVITHSVKQIELEAKLWVWIFLRGFFLLRICFSHFLDSFDLFCSTSVRVHLSRKSTKPINWLTQLFGAQELLC